MASNWKWCNGCAQAMIGMEVLSNDSVFRSSLSQGCFVCSSCKNPLGKPPNYTDIEYRVHRDKPFCDRCFALICKTCDQVISGTHVLLGKDKYSFFLKRHFGSKSTVSCWNFALLSRCNIYTPSFCTHCIKCYKQQNKVRPTCGGCNKVINDEKWVTALGLKYHHNCFVCAVCRKPFKDKEFIVKAGKAYCQQDKDNYCYNCSEPIVGGESFVTHNKKKIHHKCFKCADCNQLVDPQLFRDLDGLVLCDADYRRRM